jgi:hypothetical protein
MEKVALGTGPPEYSTFLLSVPFQKCFIIIFLYTLLLPENLLENNAVFRKSRRNG